MPPTTSTYGCETASVSGRSTCRKKVSIPRSYAEPQFDPLPLQSLLTRFEFPVLIYAGTTQATIIAEMGEL